ncbi:MAG: NapC/NirT family cytochrome c [Gammaproteobacteria bacterium]
MIKKIWLFLRSPSTKYSIGSLLVVGIFTGIIFWGGFNTVVDATNTEKFCISCHEMKENVYQEYKETIHYSNRTGVRAICSDCHVPKSWVHKIARKIQATNELFHKIIGTINTPEKFNANRLNMASRVWRVMKKTDSRECRNCHNFNYMNMEDQTKAARRRHLKSIAEGKTCIDCHQGIAHELPEDENDDNYEKAISGK